MMEVTLYLSKSQRDKALKTAVCRLKFNRQFLKVANAYIFGKKKKKNAKQITADFGSKCWLNVLQYALIGKMCCFWRNVLFLEKCAVFG